MNYPHPLIREVVELVAEEFNTAFKSDRPQIVTEKNLVIFTEIICMKNAYAQYARLIEMEKLSDVE